MHISFELKWLLRLPVAAAAGVQTIESLFNLKCGKCLSRLLFKCLRQISFKIF